MTDRIQAVRGMNDVLPADVPLWRQIERAFEHCLMQYGYEEIRFPIVENTALFKRTIGEITDIVEKEMYTFDDRNGDSLTLRPEGTAGCVRACVEHGLLHRQTQKLGYSGPVFRYEKPQKGRYRQFTQFGVEAFGFTGVAIELELLAMCQRLWQQLGLTGKLHLEINTLGERAEREAYRLQLITYFQSCRTSLDSDSLRRLEENPLRILDSKNPEMASIIKGAPKLIDTVGENSQQQFKALREGLDALSIAYTINPSLVRGLDYYGGLVFEWVTPHLGSQATVCAGGRFDTLVEQFGGSATPAVGFGIGAERLLLLMAVANSPGVVHKSPLVFMMATDEATLQHSLLLAENIRTVFPDERVMVNTAGGGFKSQFKKADKSGARFALILGSDEWASKSISVKNLHSTEAQMTLPQSELIAYLQQNTGE